MLNQKLKSLCYSYLKNNTITNATRFWAKVENIFYFSSCGTQDRFVHIMESKRPIVFYAVEIKQTKNKIGQKIMKKCRFYVHKNLYK